MSRNKFKRNVDYVTKQELTKTVGEIPKAKIATLTDVDTVSNQPTDGDVLVYDEALGKWIPNAPQSSTLPYKSYVALLTQNGPHAPVATEILNEIGQITFARNSDGIYLINSPSSSFIEFKTVAISNTYTNNSCSSVQVAASNAIILYTHVAGVLADSQLLNSLFEIRVYN